MEKLKELKDKIIIETLRKLNNETYSLFAFFENDTNETSLIEDITYNQENHIKFLKLILQDLGETNPSNDNYIKLQYLLENMVLNQINVNFLQALIVNTKDITY